MTEQLTREELEEVNVFLEIFHKLAENATNKSQPLNVGDEIILTINRGNGQNASHKGKIVSDNGSHWLIEFADVSGKYPEINPYRELIAKRSRKTELKRA